MYFQNVSRTEAQVAFITAKNGFATTLTTGYVCAWDFKNDTNGVTVSQPQSATNSAWYAVAGAAGQDIAAAGFGRIAAYGMHSVYCSSTNAANDDIEIGQVVGQLTATFKLVSNGLSDGKSGAAFIAAERIVSNTLGSKNVFIRAL